MAAKFKYCTTSTDLVIKDLKVVPRATGSYQDGELLAPATADTGGLRSVGEVAATGGAIIGVSNQGDSLPAAATLQSPGVTTASTGYAPTGTQAAGTIENIKVIINSDAVYAVQYDDSARLTWSAVTDTTVAFADGGTGFADLGGGFAWSYLTGELDYIVSSAAAAGTTTATTVTGTDTTSATGIVLLPTGYNIAIPTTIDGLQIDADFSVNSIDPVTPGTDVAALNGVILENRIESQTHGSEILDPVVHNQEKRYMRANTAQRDLAKAFAYVKFNHVLNN
jgi:hypothetical protein